MASAATVSCRETRRGATFAKSGVSERGRRMISTRDSPTAVRLRQRPQRRARRDVPRDGGGSRRTTSPARKLETVPKYPPVSVQSGFVAARDLAPLAAFSSTNGGPRGRSETREPTQGRVNHARRARVDGDAGMAVAARELERERGGALFDGGVRAEGVEFFR